jgi:low affinity Fe/Cu permease
VRFDSWTKAVAGFAGRWHAFVLAVVIVLGWGAVGPIFDWSDTWQLVINTGTTIITFLMVFLLQNSQNRDTSAINLKLDELILVTAQASNKFIGLETAPQSEIQKAKEELERD